MKDGIQKDLLFMDSLKKETMDKGEIFAGLCGVIGRDKDLRGMHLPSSPNIIRLQSNLIKGKFKINQSRIAGYMNKILHAENQNQKEELCVMLKSLTPQHNEYAMMAMDNYLNLDKKNTIEDFFAEYEDFRKEMLKSKINNNGAQQSESKVLPQMIVDSMVLQGANLVM